MKLNLKDKLFIGLVIGFIVIYGLYLSYVLFPPMKELVFRNGTYIGERVYSFWTTEGVIVK